jgi:hypothetical protein
MFHFEKTPARRSAKEKAAWLPEGECRRLALLESVTGF